LLKNIPSGVEKPQEGDHREQSRCSGVIRAGGTAQVDRSEQSEVRANRGMP